MKIILNRLSILNFKGIRSLSIDFGSIVNISGENASGKTTIFDAFLWVLFGKDSTDRKDFELKTLDPNNQPYLRMDHEVSANLTIDGEDIVLKKTFVEKWVKKRGETESVFSGHETGYYWNDVPMKQEEYQAKISALVPETIFKLITNTGYFNNLKWQDRRRALLQIAGAITNSDITGNLKGSNKWNSSNEASWAPVIQALDAKKTEDEFKRELQARKKKIKDELDTLPTRINEAQRSLGEELDYSALETELKAKKEELVGIDDSLMDITANQRKIQEAYLDKMKQMQGHQSTRTQLEYKVKNEFRDKKMAREQVIADKKRNYQTALQAITRADSSILVDEGAIKHMEEMLVNLRAQFKGINAEALVFNENEFHCPACKRAFDDDNIEARKKTLSDNFNLQKTERLNDNRSKGVKLNQDIIDLKNDVQGRIDAKSQLLNEHMALNEEITKLEAEHSNSVSREALEVERSLATNPEYAGLTKQIIALQEQLNAPTDAVSSEYSTTLMSRKRLIASEIDEINKKLASKDQRTRTLARIKQLEDSESDLANRLAGDEGIEFAIDQFIKAKMDTLEERINGRFRILKFKLFETQINGGEVECCEALINGVPYSDANTASKINAGLDVINTLCDHYQVYAPVFVDNAESVNTLIPVNSQLIRLIVSKDKKLKIENPQMAMAEAI